MHVLAQPDVCRKPECEKSGYRVVVQPAVERTPAKAGGISPYASMSADEMQPDEIGELLRRKVESEQSGKRVAVDVVGKIVAIQFDYFPGWVSELPRAEAETDNLRRIVETLEPKDPYDAIEFVRAFRQAVRPSRSQLHRNGPEVEDDQLVVLQYAREVGPDRKSTRLNSSHSQISYAVFCLKKKTTPCHQVQFA